MSIESFIFENYGNGTSVSFNTNNVPFHRMHTYEEWRTEEREKPREHGLWPSFTYFGKRVWQAEGEIIESTPNALMTTRSALKKVLMPSPHLGNKVVGRIRVTFLDTEEMYSEVTIDGYELPMDALFPSAEEYMIVWKAFDPRCYSMTLYTQQIGTPGIVGGRSYNKTYNKSYSALSGTNDVIISNLGQAETHPIFEIYGPVQSPQIILIRGGTQYVFELDGLIIPSGDYAIVDTNPSKRSVVSNNGANWYSFAHNSQWWALEPGNNSVRFSAFSASAPAKTIVKWRNAYMP